MKELKSSKVVFLQEPHKYVLGEKELSGITGLIQSKIFPDLYKDIPSFVLDKAARRGSFVHETIEMYDSGFIPSEISPELGNYIAIKSENKLNTIASEYVVSDNEHYASCIDIVLEDEDGNIVLADIKTTSDLHLEYVRWQLSIYAYFFEFQNPTLKASKLAVIWLRDDKSRYVELKRVPTKYIKELLKCGVDNTEISQSIVEISKPKTPRELKSAERAIYKLQSKIEELTKQKKQLSDGMLELMKLHNVQSYKGELISMSRRATYEREDIDKSKLKSEYPDIYEKCIKKTNVSESITIKLNKDGE